MLKCLSHEVNTVGAMAPNQKSLTLGRDGALRFAANNFGHDPTASYFGIQSSVICIFHLFPWTDLSIPFNLKVSYLQ